MVYVFHAIHNFRDLADSVQRRSKVCSRSIFRSATLDYATEQDLEKLVEELNVNTILDLRSEIEAQMSKTGKPFISFPVATTLKLKPSDMTEPDPEPSVHEKTDGPTRKTIMINFAGQKFRKFAVWKAAPLKTKMQIVGLIASGQKPRAVKLVGEEIIARKGLYGLYRDFIDYCDQEICEALQVLADSTNYPILVHCTQGKDRTGLVTALALAAAGIEEDKIIEDYSKSQQGLAPVRDHMVHEMQKDGLDPSFADAPPEVMKKTFDYIKDKYNGVEGYLDYIGFNKKDREGLRKALTFKAMQLEMQNSPQPQTGTHARSHHRSHTLEQAEGVSSAKNNNNNNNNMSDTKSEGGDVEHKKRSKEMGNKPKEGLSPWSKDKPREMARSLGIPIGWRRRSDFDCNNNNNNTNNNNSNNNNNEERPENTTVGKYLSAHPRGGVELLGSGLGLNLPLSGHHHRVLSDDSSSSPSTITSTSSSSPSTPSPSPSSTASPSSLTSPSSTSTSTPASTSTHDHKIHHAHEILSPHPSTSSHPDN